MSGRLIGRWRVLACASGALACGVILGLALERRSWELAVIGVALTMALFGSVAIALSRRDDGEAA
jgi:hypothetical protein